MNGAAFLVAVLCLVCMVALPWALMLDRRDRDNEYHLMHGPDSGCIECEDK